jgi:hypothetical protein
MIEAVLAIPLLDRETVVAYAIERGTKCNMTLSEKRDLMKKSVRYKYDY